MSRNSLRLDGIMSLTAEYAAGRRTPLSEFENALRAIDTEDGAIRSFVALDIIRARILCEASKARWEAGAPLSPIDGVLFGVKANIAIEGLAQTAGIAAYRDRVAVEDAACVSRLIAKGAVPLGLCNMHEAALGATNDGPLYGRAFLPGFPGFTPGGSSGGSAAAVAAGFVHAALGSDTMGSVRIPSAYCGIVGFKPSFGRISRRGLTPLSWSLDHVGLHVQCAEDAALISEALFAPDPEDAWSVAGAGWGASVDRVSPRLGVLAPHWGNWPDLAAFAAGIAALRTSGFECVDVELNGYDLSRMRRKGLLVCEVEGAVTHQAALASDPEGFSPNLRSLFAYGARQSSVRYAEALHEIAQTRPTLLRAFAQAQCYLLIAPTATHTAFAHDGPVPEDQADFTALANFAGAPAITLPIRGETAGLAFGLQVIGRPGEDETLLAGAARMEQALKKSGVGVFPETP